MHDLTASIVAYKNPPDFLAHAMHSFLEGTTTAQLYIIDNSPTDGLKHICHHPRVHYIFNNRNLGFGAAHNKVLEKILHTSRYHLVLNPDVYFDSDVIGKLHAFMEQHKEIGHIMPKVLYPDGRLQPLCRLLPAPKTLIMRRFFGFLHKQLEKENHIHELHASGYNKIMDVPFLSGCFMFLRTDALKKIGLFDERFFLYTEDADLTRRIHKHYRTVYFPEATIYHHHARGSYKNPWLLWCGVRSSIQYFNKWGWTWDDEREFFNQRTLLQLRAFL